MVSLVIHHGRIRKKLILNKQKEHDFVKVFIEMVFLNIFWWLF